MIPTKAYVASKFEETEAVREAHRRLREIGIQISHDWTTEDAGGRTGAELDGYLQECAKKDFEGVFDADFVLLLNHEKAFGAMVETGLALAWGRVVYVVAPQRRDNIFYHLPASMGVRLFASLDEAVAAVKEDWCEDVSLDVHNSEE